MTSKQAKKLTDVMENLAKTLTFTNFDIGFTEFPMGDGKRLSQSV